MAATEMKLGMRYVGPAVEGGRLDADELGTAILGLATAMGRTSRILYGDETRVRLEVQADFEKGSFGIEFFAVASAVDLLPALTLEQLYQIGMILGAGGLGGGVIGLLRWLRGRKPKSVDRKGDTVVIQNQDGETQTINLNVYNVYGDPQVRGGLASVTRPLEHEGVDFVEVRIEKEEPQRIERADRDSFEKAVGPGDEVSVDRRITVVEVVSPVFRERNKWRFAQGDALFYASIRDEGFLEDVSKHKQLFGKGDALRVEMETEMRIGEDGRPHFDRRILRVLGRLREGRGDQLPLEGT